MGMRLSRPAAHGIAAQDLQVVEVGVAVGLAGDGQRLQHGDVAGRAGRCPGFSTLPLTVK